MKARIVYESLYGNTRAIAEAIAQGLSTKFDTETVEVGEAPATTGGIDLVVVGGPTHAWAMSRPMTRNSGREQAARQGVTPISKGIGVREWLEGLGDGHGTMGAAFDTGAGSFGIFSGGSAAKGEARDLSRAGFRVIDDPKQFLISMADGATVLKPGELDRARQWGEALAARAAAP